MNSPAISIGFRIAASAAAAAMLVQAVLAGLALSGRPAALKAHVFNGAAVFILSVAQMVFVILLRRRSDRRWPLIASATLLLGQMLQMASGRFLLLSAHIPIGVGLFGLMTILAYWAWVWCPQPVRGNADTGVSALAPNSLQEYEP
jgi:hypothetical protein